MGKMIWDKSWSELIEERIEQLYGLTASMADVNQIYKAVATAVNDILRAKRKVFNTKVRTQKQKRVYYLSMEFLMGKSLKNNVYNLGQVDEINEALKSYDLTLEDLYEQEPDAALGNGGLGRLGACYLDALSNLNLPAMGFSLRYEYGLFKQKIVDGYQTELPDIWLPGGEVWLAKRRDKTFNIKFDGWVEEKNIDGKVVYDYKDYNEIEAVPYDMMVSGKNGDAISVLRLWRSRNIKKFDLHSFSQGDYLRATQDYNDAELITKVLYPSDDHYQGKTLRLKQQYFLCSASIQNIVADHIHYYGDIKKFDKYSVIHINDTHPALAIPELMRLLMDVHGLSFDEAWKIVTNCVCYTNHTVMSEALERWSEDLISHKLPRIYMILKQINQRFIDEARCLGVSEHELQNLLVINNGEIRMANLCVVASMKVNGVSGLHSQILKDTLFNGYYKIYPDRFVNVTNGIAYRRWLCQSNPELCEYLDKLIGPEYRKDAKHLEKLLDYIENDEVLNKLGEIKYQNKCKFAKYLYKKFGIVVDPKTRFDVQVKRLHEYKRQLLNVLKIVALIVELEENSNKDVTPQTFIFGAKAASSYYIAKDIIHLINSISTEIANRPELREKINVVFVEDYNVTTAEVLMPASEISEQISLAGKEASGTGNMKFMINGAVTLGTLDGANVEINEAVGEDNIFIFGMRTPDVKALWDRGYYPIDYYHNNERIRKVLDRIDRGFNGKSFWHIKEYLIKRYPVADPFMCLADFNNYMATYYKLDQVYRDQRKWNQMSLVNIAKAGIFSADRSISEYAENIWDIKPVE